MGSRTCWGVEGEGVSTRDGEKQRADGDVAKKLKGVWVGGFVSVKYIVPLEARFFIRSFHMAHRAFSTK